MNLKFPLRAGMVVAGVLAVATFAPAKATRAPITLTAPAAAYVYGGVVYDRYFSVSGRPRLRAGAIPQQRDTRLGALSAPPYAITDLTPIAANIVGEGTRDGFGIPTAVDDAGSITYYDQCECAGNDNNIALIVTDSGSNSYVLYENGSSVGADSAIPYGISPSGNSAGGDYAEYGPGDLHVTAIAWSATGGTLYQSHAADRTYALAIDDAGTSVGQDMGVKGTYAAAFSLNARGAVTRTLLAPPKNTTWIGTATAINDAGEIVGYATFGSGSGRAVRFFAGANAQILPVAAAGVSSSAQAINVHGDVVGNAGSRAFLYRSNRVAYLPPPPGEGAGNAVAYAVNASDEVVGDITLGGSSTAFLYTGGQAYDLNALLPANSGWQIVHATGINDSGQIVGVGYYSGEGGALTAFSMKPEAPTPAPGTVVEYHKGITGYPQNIVSGPDGNMWFTETVGGSAWVGKVTHDGVVTEYSNVVIHDPPGGIASGSDGNVWYAGNASIGKITPSGVATEYTAGLSIHANPASLVAGPDGNLWFVEPLLDQIGKITPAGVVTEYKDLPTSDGQNSPTAITAGPDGNLWFIQTGIPNNEGTPGDSIGKITPAGAVTLYPYPGALQYLIPTQIASGPDGNIWVAPYPLTTSQPTIAKVTTQGVVTEFPAGVIDPKQERPFGISAGPDGNVWYTQSGYDVQQICSITPAGRVTSYTQGLLYYIQLNKITNGGDGYLWFTNSAKQIGKIKT
jgi:streptogramin lyase